MTKKTLKELEEDLTNLIQAVQPEVKSLWQSGNKTKSVGLEINIEKAEDALQKGEPKQIESMIDLLQIYEHTK